MSISMCNNYNYLPGCQSLYMYILDLLYIVNTVLR